MTRLNELYNHLDEWVQEVKNNHNKIIENETRKCDVLKSLLPSFHKVCQANRINIEKISVSENIVGAFIGLLECEFMEKESVLNGNRLNELFSYNIIHENIRDIRCYIIGDKTFIINIRFNSF